MTVIADEVLSKVAFIRKFKGQWVILSEKDKILGKFDTKEQAKSRLRQIEFFKHFKKQDKNHAQNSITYSSLMRKLNKDSPTKLLEFRQKFKKSFDQALLEGKKSPEDIALLACQEFTDKYGSLEILDIAKIANDLGDPESVGRYLSQLILFILRRISDKNRPRSIQSLKRKIYMLNEYELANKRMPASASLGTVLTLVKHILFKHPAPYVRQVLNSIVSNL